MMQQLIDALHTEQCSLVVLHEGQQRIFRGRGVRRLYNLMNNEPELFFRAKIAAKAIGRTAARMMVQGDVSEVYADYISQQAYDTLQDANIKTTYDKKVDHQQFLKLWEQLGQLDQENK